MSAVPPIAPRMLDALHPGTAGAGLARETSTPVACAFVRLEAALDAPTAALAALDRNETAVIAAHGYPRVLLPDTGGPPAHAAELRRRQAVLVRARRPPTLARPARAREVRTARDLSDTPGHLLLAPVETRGDFALKLAVLIAAGEATADDAAAFP